MPPKIKLVAKSDAEIALERKYELLRKQRAGVAAGPAPPGAKRVGDPGRTAAVASSSAAGSGAVQRRAGRGDQKPMTAFERAKLMLARDAERKRVEAEKRKAKQASSQPSSDDPFAAHRRREEDLSRDASTLPKPLPKKKTPPLKRPAARPSAAAAHKRPRDETYAYATGDAGAHETPSAYASTNPATTTAPPSSSADPSAPRVVFVSDLPEACAAGSLASALYRFGNVDDARVAEGRRFGFVTFAEPEGAAKAVRALAGGGGGRALTWPSRTRRSRYPRAREERRRRPRGERGAVRAGDQKQSRVDGDGGEWRAPRSGSREAQGDGDIRRHLTDDSPFVRGNDVDVVNVVEVRRTGVIAHYA